MSERAELLIELGCEELPAQHLETQSRLLAEGLSERLAAAGLVDAELGCQRYATPRRLAVYWPAVLARQADREIERKGPALTQAFDASGQPTRAAEGFARSVGLAVEQLQRLETEQGAWLYARIQEPGRQLEALLPELLDDTVKAMAGARSMRWSDRSERFLRPVRWLVALHGERVLRLEAFGLSAGRESQGHRMHAPGAVVLGRPADYLEQLESAYVLADPARRRARIQEGVERLAAAAGLSAVIDAGLIDENAGLTEWPVAVMGSFDPDFLNVPEEALMASMQQHQKCFPLRDPSGALVNRFIAIANIDSQDPAAMTAGFERVIRPRLADARFFWDQDRKTSLAQRRARLDEILFQDKLGSIGAKLERVEALAAELAGLIGADEAIVRRAAELCKSDLVSDMVGEFPELQGIMGRHYALVDGEDPAVADAIASHYQPRQAGDALPRDPAGQALALADRLDSLVGIIGAGGKPKGGKDPFALRRAALAVVRILEDSACPARLSDLIQTSLARYHDCASVKPDSASDIEDFINERLRSHAAEAGIETNTLHAVAAGKAGSVVDFMARARAVQAFVEDDRSASLIGANKRASNLLKQAEAADTIGDVDRNLLQEPEEKALFDAIAGIETTLRAALARADYATALTMLSGLHEPVDAFFEGVMVMCEDAALKANRLRLLRQLTGLIADIADLSRLGRG